jgi:GNAT superfamily N-acetyltransferase
VRIIPFDFEPDLVKKFIDFSWVVYRDDPQWIPPFRDKLLTQLSPQNPFLHYGSIKNFLLEKNGSIRGRISAIVNKKASESGEVIGYLGFFESVNDYSVTEELIKKAVEYLREKGIQKVYAPVNFSTWHKYRFMTKGFTQSPFFLEPYNPPYYPEFFLKCGFKKAMGYVSNILENYTEQIAYTDKKLKRFLESGYSLKKIDLPHLHNELKLLFEISKKSFFDAWGYTETTLGEFLTLYEGLERIIDPDFVIIAYDPQKKPVGFAFCLPNYADAVRKMDGKKNIPAKIRFLLSKGKAKEFIIKSLAVTPESQGTGVGSVLMGHVQKAAHKKGFTSIIHALMRADNVVIRKISEQGGKVFKEYAIYELNL